MNKQKESSIAKEIFQKKFIRTDFFSLIDKSKAILYKSSERNLESSKKMTVFFCLQSNRNLVQKDFLNLFSTEFLNDMTYLEIFSPCLANYYDFGNHLILIQIFVNVKFQEMIDKFHRLISKSEIITNVFYSNLISCFYVVNNNFKGHKSLNYFTRSLSLEINTMIIFYSFALKYFNKGYFLLFLTKYHEAAELFEITIFFKPNFEPAIFNKGRCLQGLGKFNLSIDLFEIALTLNANYLDALVFKGFSLRSLKKNEEAVQTFQKADELNSKPYDRESYLNKGLCLDGLRKFETSIKFYDKLIEIDPCDRAFKFKGDCLYDYGKVEEAVDFYDKALYLNPRYGNALFNKGCTLRILKQYDKANQAFDQLLTLNQKNPLAYFQKGKIQNSLKEYEKSIEFFNKAISLEPENVEFYCEKANCLDDMNRKDEAIAALIKATEIDSNYEYIYSLKGYIFLDLKLYKESLESYDKYLSYNPEDSNVHFQKARIHSILRNFEFSIDAFNLAIKYDPGNSKYYYEKACCLEDMKKEKEAVECVENALKIDPEYVNALYFKGCVLFKLKEFKNALISIEKLLEVNPNVSDAHYQKGKILAVLNDPERSLQSFDTAIKITPTNANYYCEKVRTLYAFKRETEKQTCIECLNKAIRVDSKNEFAYRLKAAILFDLKKYKECIEWCNKFLQMIQKSNNESKAEIYLFKSMSLNEVSRTFEAKNWRIASFYLDPTVYDRLFMKKSTTKTNELKTILTI